MTKDREISYAQYHVEACMIQNHKDFKRRRDNYIKERDRLRAIRKDIIKQEDKNGSR